MLQIHWSKKHLISQEVKTKKRGKAPDPTNVARATYQKYAQNSHKVFRESAIQRHLGPGKGHRRRFFSQALSSFALSGSGKRKRGDADDKKPRRKMRMDGVCIAKVKKRRAIDLYVGEQARLGEIGGDTIRHGNAARKKWKTLPPREKNSFIEAAKRNDDRMRQVALDPTPCLESPVIIEEQEKSTSGLRETVLYRHRNEKYHRITCFRGRCCSF